MPSYLPIDTAWPIVTELLDDDVRSAALWNVPLEATLDGLEYVRARLLRWQMSDADVYSYAQKVPLDGHAVNGWAEEVHAGPEYTHDGYYQSNNAGNEVVSFNVNPPHAMARLQSVHAVLHGYGHAGAGAHAALPAVMPVLKVWLLEDGVPGLIGSTTDASATKEIYDADHTVSVLSLDEDPIPFGDRLVVQIVGESGANSQANSLLVKDIVAVWETADTIP